MFLLGEGGGKAYDENAKIEKSFEISLVKSLDKLVPLPLSPRKALI